MKAINLTNIYNNDIENRQTEKTRELETIHSLVQLAEENDVSKDFFKDFFYGYKIPNLSIEFDLLKVNSQYILNLELKSEMPKGGEDQIQEQLIRLSNYLSSINKKKIQYTYVAKTREFYKLNRGKKVIKVEGYRVFRQLNKLFTKTENVKDNIGVLFNPDYYLVSPTEKIKEFLKKQYFLTDNQESIKNEVLAKIKEEQKIAIVGSNKSGRTLLIFDIALHLSKTHNVYLFINSKQTVKLKNNLKMYPFSIYCKDTLRTAILQKEEVDYIIIDDFDKLSDEDVETLYYFCLKKKAKVLFSIGSSMINKDRNPIIKKIFENIGTTRYLGLNNVNKNK
jgi:hypothetical protein